MSRSLPGRMVGRSRLLLLLVAGVLAGTGCATFSADFEVEGTGSTLGTAEPPRCPLYRKGEELRLEIQIRSNRAIAVSSLGVRLLLDNHDVLPVVIRFPQAGKLSQGSVTLAIGENPPVGHTLSFDLKSPYGHVKNLQCINKGVVR
jgi:hypothetical protein